MKSPQVYHVSHAVSMLSTKKITIIRDSLLPTSRIYRRYRAKLLWLKVNKAARKRLWEMQRALLPKSKPVVKSRFTREAHRRVWARTAFAPDGGWPGIVETLTYDLMEFADHPPALGISGLRTLKISLAPGNLGEDYMLCAKRKCWVGIPVYFTPAVSQPRFLQPEHSVGIETRYTRAASPYGQETESVCRIKDTAVTPTRIYKAESRHDQMRKLGWSLQAHDTFDIAQNSDAVRSNGSLNIQAMPFIDISARRFRDTNSTRDQTFLDNASKTFSRIDYRLTSRGGDATGDRSGPLATAAMSAEMYTKRLQSPWGGFISKLFHKKTDRHTNRLKARVGTAVRGAKIHIASSSMNISGVVSDTKNKVPGRKVRQHYRTEFTWLPQTLLSAAVNADRFDRQAAIAIAVAAGSDMAVKQEVGSSVFLTLPQNHFPASDITSFADVEDHIDESACKESNDEIRALEERMMLIEEKINAAKHLEDNKQPEGPFYICGLESSTFSQSVHANGNTHSFHRHSAWPSAQKQIGQLPVRCDHSSGDRGRGISASDKVASSPTTVSDFIAADFSATFLKDPPDGNTPVDEILHPYHWL